jgi:hypothetical protein
MGGFVGLGVGPPGDLVSLAEVRKTVQVGLEYTEVHQQGRGRDLIKGSAQQV